MYLCYIFLLQDLANARPVMALSESQRANIAADRERASERVSERERERERDQERIEGATSE